MSKKSKAASKQTRLNKKRAIKQANKNRYATMRQAGENSKSVRFIRQNKRTRVVNKIDHIEGRCGNIGCNTCNAKHTSRNIRTISLNSYLYLSKFNSKIRNAIIHDSQREFANNLT